MKLLKGGRRGVLIGLIDDLNTIKICGGEGSVIPDVERYLVGG
jgi:hypothetical protein